MSVATVVRKDVRDARRARVVRLVGGSYVLLVALFFLQTRLGTVPGPATALHALWNLAFVGAVFVPAVALVAAYLSIAGERESGSVKHLLSTPVTRRDVVVGKYVARALVVVGSLAVAFAVAAVLAAVWFGAVRPAVFASIAALTALYALAYVAVAIAVSASAASRSRAVIGALGFYFGTNAMTMNEDVSGIAGLRFAANDLLGLDVGEAPLQFVGMVTNPTRAYLVAAIGAFPAELTDATEVPVPPDLAWYVGPEVAVAVLLAWLVVPVAVGLRQFERADLG